MPISSELLSKAAKVYEAAEAVEDMKPKEVYESHKKCAPGEFNMHKEGGFMQKLKTLAEKQAGEPEKAPAQEQEEEETSAPAQKAAAQSKEAFLPPGAFMTPDLIHRIQDTMAKRNLPRVAGQIGGDIGGLAGLVGGGIYGAYDPGSYSGLDEKGNPALRRRSRLMGALRGAAGYGLGGALTGAALGNLGGRAYVNATAQKAAAAHAFGAKLARVLFKQAAGPFDHGFTQSGAPTANWANKGYNPHKAINTPPAMKTPDGLSMAASHMYDANRARYQFATANNPQAKIDAQTPFTQAARASNSANVAVGGKPQYSPTQQPMD